MFGKVHENKEKFVMEQIKYRAVKYIRLSSADDSAKNGESNSVSNQRRLIDEWLKSHPEIEVVGERVDDGFSGILFDRPAFKEMMEMIYAGEINCIICKDLSRLGREYIETGRHLRRIFPAYGVRFVAINDNIDTLNDNGDDLTVSLKSIINDAYCRDISIKTRSALDVKRANGDFTGACPIYGYKKDVNNHNLLVIDDYPASVVQDIFRMKLDGTAAARIADTLNSLGVLSPMEYRKDRGLPYPKGGYADNDGAKWVPNTIIRILKDETYTGTLIQGKSCTPNYKLKEVVQLPESEWHKVENAHEPIIRRHNFDLVQKILRLDTRTAPNGEKVYVFSGILICGCCGNRMTRKTVPSKKSVYYYYWCPTGKKNGCSRSTMLKEGDLIECVLDSVKAHVANIASLDELVENLDSTRIARDLSERLTVQISDNERRLNKIREFKARLYENMISEHLSKDEYKALKVKYSDEEDVVVAANEKLQNEVESVLACDHERLMWTEHFSNFSQLEELDRKTVVHLIHSIKIISKTEIEITFNYQSEYENAMAVLSNQEAQEVA
jgi:DNA invertase Pin-like site-specific DNA recombinase